MINCAARNMSMVIASASRMIRIQWRRNFPCAIIKMMAVAAEAARYIFAVWTKRLAQVAPRPMKVWKYFVANSSATMARVSIIMSTASIHLRSARPL